MMHLLLFAAWLGYQELEWWSPCYRVAIAEAYEFGITFEAAQAQHKVSTRLLHWLVESRDKCATQEQRAQYQLEVEWQQYREQAWRHLKIALDPTESFYSRRFALHMLRDDLAPLGLGIKQLWDRRMMPSSVWGD